jgi:hypothetical protein
MVHGVEADWLSAKILSARTRLHVARQERMVFEQRMDIESTDDALILSALLELEAAVAHEVGVLLLKRLRERQLAVVA